MSISVANKDDVPELISLVEASYTGRRGREPYRPLKIEDEHKNTDSDSVSVSEGWTHERGLIGGRRIDLEDPSELNPKADDVNVQVLKYEEEGDKILGCVRVEKQDGNCFFSLLCVEPEAQGRGIGSKLIQAVESWAKERKCSSISFSVVSVRQSLIDYYKRRGFQESGVRKSFDEGKGGSSVQLVPLEFIILTKKLEQILL